MGTEFKIQFSYNSHFYRARVVQSTSGGMMSFAVRPFSLTLAKGYGPQTVIYKKDGRYSCESYLSKTTPEYINAIVSALRTLPDQ